MAKMTHSEQAAYDSNISILCDALLQSKENGGIWLNKAMKSSPSLYDMRPPKGFNLLLLGLHSDHYNSPLNIYLTAHQIDSKLKGVKPLSGNKPVKIFYYDWEKYVHKSDSSLVISKEDYQAMSKSDKEQYQVKKNVKNLYNLGCTTFDRNFKNLYQQYLSYEQHSLESKQYTQELERDIRELTETSPTLLALGRKDEDAFNQRYKQLCIEMVVAESMLLRGLPAHLSEEGQEMVDDWVEDLRSGRVPFSMLETEVNHAIKEINGQELTKIDLKERERLRHAADKMREDKTRVERQNSDKAATERKLQEEERRRKAREAREKADKERRQKTEEAQHKAKEQAEKQREEKVEKEEHKETKEPTLGKMIFTAAEILMLKEIVVRNGMIHNLSELAPSLSYRQLSDFCKKVELVTGKDFKEPLSEVITSLSDPSEQSPGLTYMLASKQAKEVSSAAAKALESYSPSQQAIETFREYLSDKEDTFIIISVLNSSDKDIILPEKAEFGGDIVMPNGTRSHYLFTPDELYSPSEIKRLGAKIEASNPQGLYKEEIEKQLRSTGSKGVRFYNVSGPLAYNPPDSYLEAREIFTARMVGNKIQRMETIHSNLAPLPFEQKPTFTRIKFTKDDEGRDVLYIRPEDKKGYAIVPFENDVKEYQRLIEANDQRGALEHRIACAEKYHQMKEAGDIDTVDLFYENLQQDSGRTVFSNVRMFMDNKSPDKMFLQGEVAADISLPVREISKEQFNRIWYCEDVASYKQNLASVAYEDMKEEIKLATKVELSEADKLKWQLWSGYRQNHEFTHGLVLKYYPEYQEYRGYYNDALKLQRDLGKTYELDTNLSDYHYVAYCPIPERELKSKLVDLVKRYESVALVKGPKIELYGKNPTQEELFKIAKPDITEDNPLDPIALSKTDAMNINLYSSTRDEHAQIVRSPLLFIRKEEQRAFATECDIVPLYKKYGGELKMTEDRGLVYEIDQTSLCAVINEQKEIYDTVIIDDGEKREAYGSPLEIIDDIQEGIVLPIAESEKIKVHAPGIETNNLLVAISTLYDTSEDIRIEKLMKRSDIRKNNDTKETEVAGYIVQRDYGSQTSNIYRLVTKNEVMKSILRNGIPENAPEEVRRLEVPAYLMHNKDEISKGLAEARNADANYILKDKKACPDFFFLFGKVDDELKKKFALEEKEFARPDRIDRILYGPMEHADKVYEALRERGGQPVIAEIQTPATAKALRDVRL